MTKFLLGIIAGGLLAMVLANQQPIFARIINAEGGDRLDRFVVECRAREGGHVKCLPTTSR